MQPGLTRAVPLGIIGFLSGALFVIVLRGLQSLTPLWDVGAGIVMGTLMCAFFFVWGMGAFDPRMSAHGEGVEHHDHDEDLYENVPLPASPAGILAVVSRMVGGSLWQLTFYLTIMMILIFAVISIPGVPVLQQVAEPGADTAAIGAFAVQLPFGGSEVMVSELVLFIALIAFTMLSLGVAGMLIAWLFSTLSRNVKEVQAVSYTSLGGPQLATSAGVMPQLGAGEETHAVTAPAASGAANQLVELVLFVVSIALLYWFSNSFMVDVTKDMAGMPIVGALLALFLTVCNVAINSQLKTPSAQDRRIMGLNPLVFLLLLLIPPLLVAYSFIYAIGQTLQVFNGKRVLRPLNLRISFVVLYMVFFLVFYYALIGLVLPEPRAILIFIVVLNCIGILAVAYRPTAALRAISLLAGALARVLRGVPEFMGIKYRGA